MSEPDEIYSTKHSLLKDFAFGGDVARVFPDMVRRSVPGYETVVFMTGCFARLWAKQNSNIYDLGCSLGQSTLMMHSQVDCPGIHYFCVDNSSDMLQGCAQNLKGRLPETIYTLLNNDVETVEISNASVVALNFTLQFIDPKKRKAVIRRIHDGLLDGGMLIVSEKVIMDDLEQDQSMKMLHDEFKRAHGYSNLEISQKRAALERVMQLDTVQGHRERLVQAGFGCVHQWFQGLNFVSSVALKSKGGC